MFGENWTNHGTGNPESICLHFLTGGGHIELCFRKVNDCKMKIEALFEIINDEDMLLAFMQIHNIIQNDLICEKCKICAKLLKRGKGYFFRCSKCGKVKSALVSKNSLFFRSKLDYSEIIQIIYFFINDIPLSKASRMIDVNYTSIRKIYSKCMIICCQENKINKKKIGGEGLSIEIDESVFSKRKYNKGRVTKQKWVLGGIVRENKEIFLVPIEKRDSETLTKVIQENVKPKTKIITDRWKGYNNITKKDYQHLTVNHSVNFVDPTTKEHTNTIESVWGKVSLRKVTKCT